MTVEIPTSHQDLIEKPLVVMLATVMPDGQPHIAAVWRKYAAPHFLVVTSPGVRKAKNIEASPKVSLMHLDLDNPYRYLEVRGEVEITTEGAIELLDELAQWYAGVPSFYGHIEPEENRREHIILKITPTKIVTLG